MLKHGDGAMLIKTGKDWHICASDLLSLSGRLQMRSTRATNSGAGQRRSQLHVQFV